MGVETARLTPLPRWRHDEGPVPDAGMLPVLPALRGLLPEGLRRGTVVAVGGWGLLCLAVAAGASAAGAWCAAVGLPQLGRADQEHHRGDHRTRPPDRAVGDAHLRAVRHQDHYPLAGRHAQLHQPRRRPAGPVEQLPRPVRPALENEALVVPEPLERRLGQDGKVVAHLRQCHACPPGLRSYPMVMPASGHAGSRHASRPGDRVQ